MMYEFKYKDDTFDVELNGGNTVKIAGDDAILHLERFTDGRMFLINGAVKKEVFAVVNGETTFVDIDGVLYEFSQALQDSASSSGVDGDTADPSKIFAPMPGKIVKLMVGEGDAVEAKQQLVIVEAMKMENIVIAKGKGKVKAVNYKEGDQVDTDHPIIELELEE